MENIILCFSDNRGRILFERKLTAIPLKEEAIIQKSIKYFNDPEPCMIHRSAVRKRLFMELGEFFSHKLQEGKHELLWSEMPEEWKRMIDISEDIERITIKDKI